MTVFLVGTGLIGSTFLRLIADSSGKEKNDLTKSLRIGGIANIDKMYFSKNGLDARRWQEILNDKGEKVDLDHFINHIKDQNLSHAVFVDCTASPKMKDYYKGLFKAGVSVVTPNKYANAADIEFYKKIRRTLQNSPARFLYETNVGAGLPVIETMQTLLETGDEIERIEGILSGTLSYIFNVFDGSEPFSKVVKKAKEQGYTEPDSREDLSGNDVARKILILAREAGAEMNIEDVDLQDLLPEKAEKAASVEQFFEILSEFDVEFEEKLKAAQDKDKKLRYIAVFENGQAKVSLMEVGLDHPFYAMAGSDNIIALYTKFYNETPLVVKGPGAGANVTAAGVLGDVLKLRAVR